MARYITKDETLILDNLTPVVAVSDDYVEVYYDMEAREMARHGLDYGVARGVVQVLNPATGAQYVVELRRVRKVEE